MFELVGGKKTPGALVMWASRGEEPAMPTPHFHEDIARQRRDELTRAAETHRVATEHAKREVVVQSRGRFAALVAGRPFTLRRPQPRGGALGSIT